MVTRGDVWLVNLDPVVGSEIRKTRPCLVLSPPEMLDNLRTIIVAPLTTGSQSAPFRVPVTHAGKRGLILLDQIRTVDRVRLTRKLGRVRRETLTAALDVLHRMFAF